ncbi:MAG: DUF6020 family protein [bacterium]|nr:DUF6020 family protein [bacterium]
MTLLVSCSLGLKLGEIKLKQNTTGIYGIVLKLKSSFTNDPTNDLFVLFLIAIVLLFLTRREYTKRCKCCSAVFALCSSILLLIGRAVYKNNDLHVIFVTKFAFCKALIVAAGYFILIYYIINAFMEYLLPKLKVNEYIHTFTPKKFKITFKSCMIALIIAWMPYIIITYPCNFTGDTKDQVAQFIGDAEHSFSDRSIVYPEGAKRLLNNHHPIIHTLMVGSFATIGMKLGNINLAMFILVMIQVVFLMLVYSYTVNYIKKIGIPIIFQLVTLGFFMFYPVVPMYAMTLTKDSIYSGFMILITIQLFKIVRNEEEFFQSREEKIRTFICCLGLMLFRNNGVYILFIVIAVLLIRYRKSLTRLKSVGFSFGIPILLYWVVLLKIILPMFNIPNGSPREMLSIPFQQVARYAVEWGEEGFEDGEIEKLDKILCFKGDITVLQKRYNPIISDPVKYHFNKNYTKEEMKDFMGVWAKLLIRHPGTFIIATLNNDEFYYSVDYGRRVVYDGATKHGAPYGIDNPSITKTVRSGVVKIIEMLDHSSMLGWAFSVGTWNYMFIICILYAVYKKQYKFFIMMLPVILNVLIAFAGPVAQMRYASQWIVVLPLFGAMVWLCLEEKLKQNEIE